VHDSAVSPTPTQPPADQGGETLDQLEWGQHQAGAAARSWLDALIDQVLGIDLTQPFQREGQPGAVAQQPLQAQAIVRFMRTLASTAKPPP
jgi:hypothetical protein